MKRKKRHGIPVVFVLVVLVAGGCRNEDEPDSPRLTGNKEKPGQTVGLKAPFRTLKK